MKRDGVNDAGGQTTKMTILQTLGSFFYMKCSKLGFYLSTIRTPLMRTKTLAMALRNVSLTCGIKMARF